MAKSSDTDRGFYAAADTGFISQNVYLYCASEGLATAVRASVNREALAKAMQLRPDQRRPKEPDCLAHTQTGLHSGGPAFSCFPASSASALSAVDIHRVEPDK